jgi:formate dehydrogenase
MAINIDEGEPGTFKDRYYLERDPHRFIEGMLIGAWVVEAADIYFYLRDEYPEVRLMLDQEFAKVVAAGLAPHAKIHHRRGAGQDLIRLQRSPRAHVLRRGVLSRCTAEGGEPA